MKRQVVLVSASIILVILIAGAIPGTASPANWPMYRNNLLHTGVAADVVPPPLLLKWRQTFGGAVDSSPAVVGSRLYVGSDDGALYALDTATGNIIWSFREIAPLPVTIAWDSSPAVATVGSQTVIFAGNDNGRLYAVRDDGATSTKLWDFNAGNPINSSPMVTSISGTQAVVFGSDGGNLYALVASTGALYGGWTINPFAPGGGFLASPAILGQTIFIGNTDKNLYAVNLGNGVQLWAFLTGGAIYSSAVVGNIVLLGLPTDVVFFGSDDSSLYAVRATTGVLVWSFAVGGFIDSSPALATMLDPNFACRPGPTLAVIFGSADNNVYGVRASDGTPCWTFPSTGAQNFDSSPSISGQVIYIGSNDNNLYAIDINTGNWLWSYPALAAIGDAATPPNPAISGTTVYVGSKDNSVYAFSPPTVLVTFTSTVASTTTTTSTTYTSTASTATTSTHTSTASTTETSTIWTTTVPVPGPVPGFPIESILVGILGGLVALTLLRRRRRA